MSAVRANPLEVVGYPHEAPWIRRPSARVRWEKLRARTRLEKPRAFTHLEKPSAWIPGDVARVDSLTVDDHAHGSDVEGTSREVEMPR